MAAETTTDLDKIKNILLSQYDQETINVFINYCNEEEYEIINILEDIEDISDSCIYEHMQSEIFTTQQKTDIFIDMLKSAISTQDNKIDISDNNDDDVESNDKLESIKMKLSTKYSQETVTIFCDFCKDQQVNVSNMC